GLWPQALSVSTYYALLFTLALYLQHGLGYSALSSGLTLVPWVFAFGIPGRTLGRVPPRMRSAIPALGCLILAGSYVSIAASMLSGSHSEALLLALLAVGGLGLGTIFSSILVHLTTAATPRYAADISGVFTTTLQIAGAVGVAGFGTLYLSQVTGSGTLAAAHALGLVTTAFALTALVAGVTAYRATHARGAASSSA